MVLVGASHLALDIPTDIDTWNKCCHHEDCMEGKVEVTYATADMRTIKFRNYPEFDIDERIIMSSGNGKEYVCWLGEVTWDDGEKIGRPTDENTICIFKLYNMANK